MDNGTTVANLVRFYREERGFTQARLAARSGVSLRTIRNVESGTMEPRMDSKRKILLALGLRFEDSHRVFHPVG